LLKRWPLFAYLIKEKTQFADKQTEEVRGMSRIFILTIIIIGIVPQSFAFNDCVGGQMVTVQNTGYTACVCDDPKATPINGNCIVVNNNETAGNKNKTSLSQNPDCSVTNADGKCLEDSGVQGGSPSKKSTNNTGGISCDDALAIAKSRCEGRDQAGFAASQALQQVAGGASGGNMLAACKAAKYAGGITAGYGTYVIASCVSAVNTCWNSCVNDSRQSTCKSYRTDGVAGGGIVAAAGTYQGYQASICEKVLDADPTNPKNCKGDKAKTNEFCSNYCDFTENQDKPVCHDRNCLKPDYAKDHTNCGSFYCYQHIADKDVPKVCGGGTPTTVGGGPTIPGATTLPTDRLALPPGMEPEPDLSGATVPKVESNGKGTGVNDNFQSGSANFGSNGAPAGAGGGSAQGGSGKGPYDTNIEKGLTNGSGGGGYGVSGVAVGGGGGGSAAGRGGAGGNDNIDLSQFLPKDANGNRMPASADLVAQGISGANDLSNFEKVTRKMNQKRSLMKSQDGK